jgi:chaperonin cofactor prefoldin
LSPVTALVCLYYILALVALVSSSKGKPIPLMPNGILLSLCPIVSRSKLQLCQNMSWIKQQLYTHAERPIPLVQVQNLQGRLQVVQGQHDGLNGQVQTLQGQKAALTWRVDELQGHHGHLTGRVQQLEEQNATLGEEAASLQDRLNATVLQQHQVSVRPGMHPLHLWLAHTSVSNKCLFCKGICLPASLLCDMAQLSFP